MDALAHNSRMALQAPIRRNSIMLRTALRRTTVPTSSAANWEKIDHIDFEFGRQSALNFAAVHWIARVTSLIQAKRRQSR
jgi:hypothetical protein